MNKHQLFATCPKNLEALVEQELISLGALTTKQTVAGVYFTASLATAYRICLWSRLSNRILLILQQAKVTSTQELYEAVYNENWLTHLTPNSSLEVDFAGYADFINHSHFGALKVKDAIVDHVRAKTGGRPNIELTNPDLTVNAYLANSQLTLSIDLAGGSLHQRGYRLAGGTAPLKENLAAAILLRADWPKIAAQGASLVEPMCGSGTLLIEGAMLAADIAPGLQRQHFGFLNWPQHQADVWKTLLQEAEERKQQGLTLMQSRFWGYDHNPKVIQMAKENLNRAGLQDYITLRCQDLSHLTCPVGATPGLVIANPPYGERLDAQSDLQQLYRQIAQILKQEFKDWQAAIFTGNPELGKSMGLRAKKHYALFNGALACKLLLFSIQAEWFVEETLGIRVKVLAPEQWTPGATMFANRLTKNLKQYKRWLQQQQLECYRLYDADMPEYALAIDCYKDWVHVQEYAPPSSIDEQKAKQRLREAVSVIPHVLGIPVEQMVVKKRQQQKGTAQYEKLATEQHFFPVQEGRAQLLVNLTDYLDTGLFLDHRPLRLAIAELAKGKRFLNLFCYTATATVHAALGGAKSSISVDMSNTYLDWASQNFELNDIDELKHQLMQADCLVWLERNTEKFDLIMLDPPTFSNSKRMETTLDIQRDHVSLLKQALGHLSPGGVLFFSTNYRRFKLDQAALAHYVLKDITAQTIDKDFLRHSKVHQCWEIKHRE
jgi:23S rRNA (guanine2445-N2)-methyltransferase / 23S rRNA (guanine2069-N7)-methyltransferase